MKLYDMIKKEFVRCDKNGCLDGIPVFTASMCRKVRKWTVFEIVDTYEISMELAKEWKEKAKKIFLIMYDSKGSYKHIEDTGFEDEAGMEKRAVRYMNFNLPPECIARLKEIQNNGMNGRKKRKKR